MSMTGTFGLDSQVSKVADAAEGGSSSGIFSSLITATSSILSAVGPALVGAFAAKDKAGTVIVNAPPTPAAAPVPVTAPAPPPPAPAPQVVAEKAESENASGFPWFWVGLAAAAAYLLYTRS